MKRLTPYLRERIVTLHKSGSNNVEIMNQILGEEKVKISRKTVHFTVKRFKSTASAEIIRTATKSKKLNEDHLNYMGHVFERK